MSPRVVTSSKTKPSAPPPGSDSLLSELPTRPAPSAFKRGAPSPHKAARLTEPTAAELVSNAKRRQLNAKGAATAKKKQKRTADHKQTHYVGNRDVHLANQSARQIDSRDEVDRESELPTSWNRPSLLAGPPPRPGYVNKWVRFRMRNEEDVDNIEKHEEQGWRPVKRSAARRSQSLTANSGRHAEHYVKRGLILMELPLKLAVQRRNFYLAQLQQMTESIDRSLFKTNDTKMPLLKPQRKTRVSTTARRGRLEEIPGDEQEADTDD